MATTPPDFRPGQVFKKNGSSFGSFNQPEKPFTDFARRTFGDGQDGGGAVVTPPPVLPQIGGGQSTGQFVPADSQQAAINRANRAARGMTQPVQVQQTAAAPGGGVFAPVAPSTPGTGQFRPAQVEEVVDRAPKATQSADALPDPFALPTLPLPILPEIQRDEDGNIITEFGTIDLNGDLVPDEPPTPTSEQIFRQAQLMTPQQARTYLGQLGQAGIISENEARQLMRRLTGVIGDPTGTTEAGPEAGVVETGITSEEIFRQAQLMTPQQARTYLNEFVQAGRLSENESNQIIRRISGTIGDLTGSTTAEPLITTDDEGVDGDAGGVEGGGFVRSAELQDVISTIEDRSAADLSGSLRDIKGDFDAWRDRLSATGGEFGRRGAFDETLRRGEFQQLDLAGQARIANSIALSQDVAAAVWDDYVRKTDFDYDPVRVNQALEAASGDPALYGILSAGIILGMADSPFFEGVDIVGQIQDALPMMTGRQWMNTVGTSYTDEGKLRTDLETMMRSAYESQGLNPDEFSAQIDNAVESYVTQWNGQRNASGTDDDDPFASIPDDWTLVSKNEDGSRTYRKPDGTTVNKTPRKGA